MFFNIGYPVDVFSSDGVFGGSWVRAICCDEDSLSFDRGVKKFSDAISGGAFDDVFISDGASYSLLRRLSLSDARFDDDGISLKGFLFQELFLKKNDATLLRFSDSAGLQKFDDGVRSLNYVDSVKYLYKVDLENGLVGLHSSMRNNTTPRLVYVTNSHVDYLLRSMKVCGDDLWTDGSHFMNQDGYVGIMLDPCPDSKSMLVILDDIIRHYFRVFQWIAGGSLNVFDRLPIQGIWSYSTPVLSVDLNYVRVVQRGATNEKLEVCVISFMYDVGSGGSLVCDLSVDLRSGLTSLDGSLFVDTTLKHCLLEEFCFKEIRNCRLMITCQFVRVMPYLWISSIFVDKRISFLAIDNEFLLVIMNMTFVRWVLALLWTRISITDGVRNIVAFPSGLLVFRFSSQGAEKVNQNIKLLCVLALTCNTFDVMQLSEFLVKRSGDGFLPFWNLKLKLKFWLMGLSNHLCDAHSSEQVEVLGFNELPTRFLLAGKRNARHFLEMQILISLGLCFGCKLLKSLTGQFLWEGKVTTADCGVITICNRLTTCPRLIFRGKVLLLCGKGCRWELQCMVYDGCHMGFLNQLGAGSPFNGKLAGGAFLEANSHVDGCHMDVSHEMRLCQYMVYLLLLINMGFVRHVPSLNFRLYKAPD